MKYAITVYVDVSECEARRLANRLFDDLLDHLVMVTHDEGHTAIVVTRETTEDGELGKWVDSLGEGG